MNNLFLFTGQETFLLQEQLKRWKTAFVEKHGDINLEELDAAETPINEVMAAVNAMPFLGDKRLVFIHALPKAPSKRSSSSASKKGEKQDTLLKKMVEDLKDIPETSVVVFVQPHPDKRKSFYKQLIKLAEVKEFKPLTGYVLTQWIENQVRQGGASIASSEAEYLASLTAQNLWRLSTEIDKLIAYASGQPIDRTTIDHLVVPTVEANIFHLTDALGARDSKKAIHCLHRSMAAGEKLQPVFYMIIRQFRLLLQGVAFLKSANPSQAAFAARLKLHPFVAKNTLAQAKRFSFEELKLAYQQLLNIDEGLKTSRIKILADDQDELALALEQFILSF